MLTSEAHSGSRPDPPALLHRAIMVQGTTSHAGKTTLVAALCRLFARSGYRVAPFKAQNMSNNAAVTDTGGEVGRAQAMQAMAAGVPVTVDMNPVLLKPQSDRTSQIVVLGRVRHVANAREYYALKSELWPVVTGALDRLRAAYDLVVIEGAGSPAEINLAQYDIVNMRVARYADAPVLLAGDIERGGVFAALYGTVALLAAEEQALIRGFVINKFRGDPLLLDPGFAMLEERTGIKTLGVLPYLDLSRLPAEDAVDWGASERGMADGPFVDIVVMRLPRIANLDEFQALAAEPGVRVRYVADPADWGAPDLVIVPGTKSTVADLAWLRERGLAAAIHAARAAGTPILGICGGFQMLGQRITDEEGVEAAGVTDGLGLLPMSTTFVPDKVTRRVTARAIGANALWDPAARGATATPLGEVALDAYEIHMGRVAAGEAANGNAHPFIVTSDGGPTTDGLVSADGRVVGTHLHGLLENGPLRRAMIERLAARAEGYRGTGDAGARHHRRRARPACRLRARSSRHGRDCGDGGARGTAMNADGGAHSLTLVLGGARSGKSSHAFELARSLQRSRGVLFVATAEPLDDDMRRRIAVHRSERPPDWDTLESPLDAPVDIERWLAAAGDAIGVVVLDCLTLWVSNVLLAVDDNEDAEAYVAERVRMLLQSIETLPLHWILISNEVGLGVVPGTSLGRRYRDALGRANQTVAGVAERVVLMVAGLEVPVKPR